MDLKPGYKRTDVGVIPKDWSPILFSDVVGKYIDYRGRTPRKLGLAWGGGDILALSANNVGMGHINFEKDANFGSEELHDRWMTQGRCEKGDVLLTMEAPLGNVAQIPDSRRYILSQRVLLIKAKTAIDPNFLAHYMRGSSFQGQLVANATGSTAQGIQRAKLDRLPIAIPSAVTEQIAIAQVLSDADALIESLEQLLAKKRQIKQGAVQELLAGRRRLPGFQKIREYQHTEQGLIPKDWFLRPFLSTVRVANGQVDPRPEPYRAMILVAPDHIESGTGRLLYRRTAGEQQATSGKYVFHAGDIVYSKIRPYLKKATLADFDGLCSADMYPLRPANDVSGRYVLAAMLAEQFSNYAISVSVRTGIPKINRNELAQCAIAIPPTKEEQEAIAQVLASMDTEIEVLNAKLEKYRQIKQGMMQNLLTGQIRLVDAKTPDGLQLV